MSKWHGLLCYTCHALCLRDKLRLRQSPAVSHLTSFIPPLLAICMQSAALISSACTVRFLWCRLSDSRATVCSRENAIDSASNCGKKNSSGTLGMQLASPTIPVTTVNRTANTPASHPLIPLRHFYIVRLCSVKLVTETPARRTRRLNCTVVAAHTS